MRLPGGYLMRFDIPEALPCGRYVLSVDDSGGPVVAVFMRVEESGALTVVAEAVTGEDSPE